MLEKIRNYHTSVLFFFTVSFILFLINLGRIPQPEHYHAFADHTILGNIPNALNVLSNIPFLFIGIFGLIKSRRIKEDEFPTLGLMFFFTGVFFVGVGSAYYHWSPTNETLLWDRLPMTIAFMSLLAVFISLHMEYWAGKLLLFPLLLLGTLSCLYWYYTELIGQGDLRLYLFVQFYPLCLIPLIVFFFPIQRVALNLLLPMIGFYVIAKFFEYADGAIYQSTKMIISGHTLKHIFAALATAVVIPIAKIYLGKIPNKK